MPSIKQIKLDGVTYDLEDAYARQRLEGLSCIFPISCEASGVTQAKDIKTGAQVTLSANNCVNGSFNTQEAGDVSIAAGEGKYLLLLGTTTTIVFLKDIIVGDTVYVKETKVADRWVSAIGATYLFTELEGKSDLSGYVQKGTYTTLNPSADVTSSAGGDTVTGTASVSYKKSADATGSAGGGESDATESAGAFTVNGSDFGFAPANKTIAVSVEKSSGASVGAHAYTPEGSIEVSRATDTMATVITGVSSDGTKDVITEVTPTNETLSISTTPASTKGVKVNTQSATTATIGITGGVASGSTNVIPSYTLTAASLTSKNYGFSNAVSNIMYAPTVEDGVLSWSLVGASTQDALNGGALNPATQVSVVTGVTAASLTGTTTFVTEAIKSASLAEDTSTTPAFAFNTDAIANASSTQTFVKSIASSTATVLTGVKASGTTSVLSSLGEISATFTGTSATLGHTVTDASYTASFANSQIAGSITGSKEVEAHTHTYVKPVAHTHTITLTDATASGSSTVTIAAHTHTLSGHTHSINL